MKLKSLLWRKVPDTSGYSWQQWRALPARTRLLTILRFIDGGPEPWQGV